MTVGFFLGLFLILLTPSFTLFAEETFSVHHGLAVEAAEQDTTCLNCHDGAHANNINYCRNDCAFGSPHPVFVQYPPSGNQSYHPAPSLARHGVRLVDGYVTCISCHNLANLGKAHLATDNDRSRLCLICHIK